jgi:hypothetical protein
MNGLGSGNAMAISVDQPTPELATAAAICGKFSAFNRCTLFNLITIILIF